VSERYELPEGLTHEEERAVLRALERYFLPEHPKAQSWALAGRLEAMGYGALQARRSSEHPWDSGLRVQFTRRGTQSAPGGRGDVG
jgi:hypothetical protein